MIQEVRRGNTRRCANNGEIRQVTRVGLRLKKWVIVRLNEFAGERLIRLNEFAGERLIGTPTVQRPSEFAGERLVSSRKRVRRRTLGQQSLRQL